MIQEDISEFERKDSTDKNKKLETRMRIYITLVFLLTIITDIIYLMYGIPDAPKILLHIICIGMDLIVLWNIFKYKSRIFVGPSISRNCIVGLLFLVLISSTFSAVSAFLRLSI